LLGDGKIPLPFNAKAIRPEKRIIVTRIAISFAISIFNVSKINQIKTPITGKIITNMT
jgi:hypothetical protein